MQSTFIDQTHLSQSFFLPDFFKIKMSLKVDLKAEITIPVRQLPAFGIISFSSFDKHLQKFKTQGFQGQIEQKNCQFVSNSCKKPCMLVSMKKNQRITLSIRDMTQMRLSFPRQLKLSVTQITHMFFLILLSVIAMQLTIISSLDCSYYCYFFLLFQIYLTFNLIAGIIFKE